MATLPDVIASYRLSDDGEPLPAEVGPLGLDDELRELLWWLRHGQRIVEHDGGAVRPRTWSACYATT